MLLLVTALLLAPRGDRVDPSLAPVVVSEPVSQAMPVLVMAVGHAPVGERVPVTLTAYCLQGTTREGRPVAPNLVAADPLLFPLGRTVEVYIRGKLHGQFRVSDTGALVKGSVIDLWMEDCQAAREFGRKRGAAVLLPPGEESSS
jgi:3D (Asp-Asp-Asp) domain-containing protein